MKSALILAACAALAACATSYDKPQIAYDQSPDTKGRIHAWSSGSAAAIGMPNTAETDPSVCVLGAAFARTGTVSSGASLVLPGKSFEGSSDSSAGALLLKNEGQTATFLDAGMFHLCMMYAQAWIKEEANRVLLLERLFSASIEIGKNSVQFASTASLQPDSKPEPKAAPAAAAAAPAAPAASAAPKPPAPAASAASGAATTFSTPLSIRRGELSAAEVRKRDLQERMRQNTAPK